jgi:hypothetical protein
MRFQRIALASPMAEGGLLGPPADLVDHRVGQPDGVEVVHDHPGVAKRCDQRAIAATSQRAGPLAAPPLDPVFVALNPSQLPAARGPRGKQGLRLRRAEEIEMLTYRTMVELNAESRLAPQRRVAAIAQRPERAERLASERTGRADRRQLQRAARTERISRPYPEPQERGWSPMPVDPTPPAPDRNDGQARSAPTRSPTWTACWLLSCCARPSR